MPGRHEVNPRTLPGRRVTAALLAAAVAIATLILSVQPAQAATNNAQITLTGLVDDNNPTGGSQLGIKPGNSIKFSASAAPTQKVKSLVGQLGLSNLLGTLLGGSDFRVTADFRNLPGGAANTVLTGSKTKTFSFPRVGTYTFTWKADQVKVGLLGTTVLPINLDGNQAKKAGIELNAENEYVGTIVVATNPPKGGISVQLPKVSVSPKVGPIQLPKVGLPGVNAPTVPVPSVPNLNLPTGGNKGGKSSDAPKASKTNGYELPGLTVPDQVVPNGDSGGGGAEAGGAGGGGLQQNAQNDNTGVFTGTLPQAGSSKAADGGSKASSSEAATTNGQKTVDLATDAGSPSSQVPVILAILAIIALALVAGTYARLFLLKQKS